MARPELDEAARRRVDACLRWFGKELRPESGSSMIEKIGHWLGAGSSPSKTQSEEALSVYNQMIQHGKDLAWTDDTRFAELSFSNQRLVLFLRAVVASPDLVILDEALSGIDEAIRDKALLFLSHGEQIAAVIDGQAQLSVISKLDKVVFAGLSPAQAVLVISHSREDVPGCLREWICLPEPGEGRGPRTGTLPGPLELNPEGWNDVWGR